MQDYQGKELRRLMFEVEYSPPFHARVRLGRWHFRTWRTRFVCLPAGYRKPEMTYAVVLLDDEEDNVVFQFGAFFDESVARECLAQLEAEGRFEHLQINMLSVHTRLKDWEWDR